MMKLRLSTMMFLQFFIWGAWFVTMGTFLSVNFKASGDQIGAAYGTTALAAIISPLLVSLLSDKWLSAPKLLSILHIIGAILLWLASQAQSFTHFYPLLLAYAMFYMPTLALVNTIGFQNIDNAQSNFPKIRVFGTIGWIAAGLVIGFFEVEEKNIPLQVGSFASLLLGLYCLSLPSVSNAKSTQTPNSLKKAFGLDALSMLKQPSFLVIFLCSMLLCIPLAFYYNFTNLFLNDLGIDNAAGKMTLGQASEVGFMLLMPFMFRYLGIKYMILIGIFAWVVRYVAFAYGYSSGGAEWVLLLGIALHGICYDFFFVTGQVYADKQAPAGLKNEAQALMTFCTYGVGMFLGSYLSGIIVSLFTEDTGIIWNKVWLVPAVLALAVFFLFALLFKERPKVPE